ncbi:hypothetical protein OPV22_008293 [Ensete ventricosum]|uniref:Uncharacterized protein n=1 Tax=Ensete ventricosum TaxID=4639 RepID=A0AAV8RFQ0_ENSVE|nr:hypothetical protein OPV22_008293 [Ensete ventricosum]
MKRLRVVQTNPSQAFAARCFRRGPSSQSSPATAIEISLVSSSTSSGPSPLSSSISSLESKLIARHMITTSLHHCMLASMLEE